MVVRRGIHNTLTGRNVDSPFSWEYANVAAMIGATGFVPIDVGRLAWITGDNSVYMLIDDSPVTWAILGLGTPAKVGSATGSYTGWDTTGHQTMIGNARPWRDALGELIGKKRVGVRITEDLAEGTLLFADNCILADDYVISNVQFNHDRDPSSNVSPHLHWFQSSANVPNWIVQYRWNTNGNPKVVGWTSKKYSGHIYTYVTGTVLQITEFDDWTPPTGTNISDIVQIRLTRDTNNSSGLFGGADPLTGNASALMFDLHLQLNSIGSTDEFTK